jgi:AraC-like DNA-binding protein
MDISRKSDKEIERHIRRLLAFNSAATLSGTFTDYSTEKLHLHPFHQILMIRNGLTVLVDETSSQALFGVQCAVIPAGVSHRSVAIGGNISYQSLYIRKNAFRWKEKSVKIFPLGALGQECFKSLGSYGKISGGRNIESATFRLFLELVSSDCSSREQNAVRLPATRTETGDKIRSYIETNYGNHLSINDFRNVIPLSFRQISRLFKQDCGITVFEYLRSYRMMTASIKLAKGETILNTAYDCGYDSISSFFADFKRYYGITPSRFAKKTISD